METSVEQLQEEAPPPEAAGRTVAPPAPPQVPARAPLLVFANRKAGALSRLRESEPLRDYAHAAGFEPELVYTRNVRELIGLLRTRVIGRERKIAIAGGDGTVHAAVQVLAGTDTILGILPQGTANNFATALRLPMDLPSAFRVLSEGEELAVSLGQADGEYFTEAAGVGLFADLLALSDVGRTKSKLRALTTLFKLWVWNRPSRVKLIVDGQEMEETAIMVAAANSFRLGMGLPIAPNARLTDCELDVVIIGPLRRREMVPYFRAIRAQTHTGLPKVKVLKARTLEIHTRRPRPVHVDDRARKRTPVTIRLAPRALKVMVDRL